MSPETTMKIGFRLEERAFNVIIMHIREGCISELSFALKLTEICILCLQILHVTSFGSNPVNFLQLS
ncbi:hypothetical protein HanIR_Chr01g0050801 [Helianthus annuus]|nr:hypothetical protein HanIR_Chr01g0050801 [Helianthus annuus]